MKIYKKLLLILAGSALALPAFFVAGNKNPVTETKAVDVLAYSTTFSGAETETKAYTDTYQWTFSEYVNRVGEGGGIGFNLTRYTTSCLLTFKNPFANPIKVKKVEIEVSSNPFDLDAENSASVYPAQGSSGSTTNITQNGVKTKVTQNFSGGISNVTIRLNNLYDGPNTIWVYSVKFYEAQTATMTITAGEGVSDVYLSDNENALTGSASGSKFEVGKTVYGFAVLEDGYEHAPGWVKVSSGDEDVEGAKYRVGSYMNAGLDHDFGTQNAIEKQTSQVVYFYDYFGNPLTDVSSHEFRIDDGAYELPDPELDDYHTFIGWNSSFDYQGTTYNQTLSAEEVDQIASGEASVTELYVMAQLVEKLQAFLTKVESLPIDVELSDEYETILKEAYGIYSGFTPEEAAVQEVADYEDYLEICWQEYVVLAFNSIGEVSDENFVKNLERAEEIYSECPEDYRDGIDASTLETAQVNYVKYLIDNIGEVALTDECKAKLDKAREEYEALGSQEQKDAVTNLDVLVTKEAEYAALLNQKKADEVIALINAIGEVTLEKENKINAAKTAYDALDNDQKALVSNVDVLNAAISQLALLKHQDDVQDNGVKVTGKDGALVPINVNLKVELKTEVKAEQGSAEYSKINSMLSENEKISAVFDVKLLQTKGDVVTEIQPSEIKEGMILIIEITLPDGLSVEGLKVLHIHSEEDIAFVNNFTINGNKLVFETDRLSEIAFVTYHLVNAKTGAGLPGWAIALIVIGAILVTCCLAYFLLLFVFNKWIRDEQDEDKAHRVFPFAFGEEDDKKRLFAFPCKFFYREKEEIYKSKKDALKELK